MNDRPDQAGFELAGDDPWATPGSALRSQARPAPVEQPVGVFRHGDLLVMDKGAALPGRCVKCNAVPTTNLERNLSWHHPWVYFLIFAHILAYIIVASIVRKSARIQVPLCDLHRSARRRKILLAWLMFLGSILAFSGLWVVPDLAVLFVIVAVVLLIAAIAVGFVASQPVVPRKIDKTHVWIKKVCPEYLQGLPDAPSNLRLR